jgi:hypothetical protein
MSLPPCHSRLEIEAGSTTYFCAHPRVHIRKGLVTAEICNQCQFWKLPPPPRPRTYPIADTARDVTSCRYLGEQIGLRDCVACRGRVRVKVFACHHPNHTQTIHSECATCPDYERQLPAPTAAGMKPAHQISTWAVGVTTAPRKGRTLERCLNSLESAGWQEARVFIDGELELRGKFRAWPATLRDTTLGAWPNWFLGLSELVLRSPHADAYFIVQDDAIFCKNVRPFLEHKLWPSDQTGVVSVYCPQHYGME